jgi:type I restriction enzyme R subunit
VTSSNFAFLSYFGAPLVEAAARAELVIALDPVGALNHLRLFGEAMARAVCVRLGLGEMREEKQVDRLRCLDNRGISPSVLQLFHTLRTVGNRASHEGIGNQEDAFTQLKIAWQLAVWFQRSFGSNRKFDPGPFVPPRDLKAESDSLRAELKQLRAVAAKSQAEIDEARANALAEAKKALGIQEAEARAREERELWESLAREAEAQRNADQQALAEAQKALALQRVRYEAELASLQTQAQSQSAAEQQTQLERTVHAAAKVNLDEAATRAIIDEQLRAAGWEANTQELRFARGTRPEKGRLLAVAEWPTSEGPADYVLFDGLTALAVVEAKKVRKDVAAALEQSKRYASGFTAEHGAQLAGGPWGKYHVPFLFATNGRPYLKQLETKSGLWFRDARRAKNLATALDGWYSPEGLRGLLKQDIDRANERLATEPTDYLELRDYQIRAIQAVEHAIVQGQREILLAMATGTGKTRTAIGLVYRLLKAQRFRRVLFLVDRTMLGRQSYDAFNEVQLENLQTFSEIYGVKGLDEQTADNDTKLHIATVQGMVRRLLESDNPADVPTVDAYDCIVIDECHRGYGLDQEMSDTELNLAEYGIRNQTDYISKYRRVLEHFHCTKIGLTATPAAHTTSIFGEPIYTYSYREAVIDGCLIDHEPPINLTTYLSEHGIHWEKGAQVPLFDPATVTRNLVELEDEVDLEIDSFNRTVVTENFNQVICAELAKQIDPNDLGKTLIFCATDFHADIVVRRLKEAFQAEYGEVDDDAVVKITGSADKPQKLLRRYKNERLPNVAVTVDLLTTGVDVPKIVNLVFLRRVRSRILYEQMIGRATRLCPEIEKDSFRIFDAVALYEALESVTQMKTVVQNPKLSFAELVQEIIEVKEEASRQLALDQFVAKLQRKKQRLKGDSLYRFNTLASMSPEELTHQLKASSPAQAAQWFAEHRSLVESLDEGSNGNRPLLISDHHDELIRVERGYGKGNKPDDYLEAFERFVRTQLNQLPALLVVAQRPRDLTRKQLKELALELDKEGFNEKALQVAWRDKTNEDIAASIIGFIRKAALGDPLIAYEERVDRALKKLLASRPWTDPHRKWLSQIGKQLKKERVLDRQSFDEGQFASDGGYARWNKKFDGKLETLLREIADEMWMSTG